MATTKSNVFVREATGLVRYLSARDVLMFNLLNMGLPWPLLYVFFAGAGYPGIDTPVTVLIAFLPNVLIAMLYYYMTSAFPRTGGDYVWVSRIIHPAVGFMESFGVVVFFLSFLGPVSGWLMTYGLGTMFYNLAIATGNTSYMTLAAQVTSQNSILLGSLLVLAIVVLAAAVGIKNTFRYTWVTFVVVVLGLTVFLLALATSSPTTFQNNFNALSGSTYQGIIDAANKAGYVTVFTISGIILGTFYSFLNYLGYNFSTYIGGEVKQNQRSQLIGVLGSVVVFAVIVFLVFEAPFAIMGGQFINSAALLAGHGSAAYTLPSPPVSSYLVIFANPSMLVAVLVPLAIIASVLGSLETIVLATVRIVFAWSFDGVMPAKLSQLNRRGSPNFALALIAVIGLVYILISIFEANVLTFLAYTTSGLYLSIAFVGLSGLIFPYRKKAMFQSTPASVQRKVGGMPVIAILGLATFVVGVFVAVAAASPAYTGAAVNPYYVAALVSVFVGGLAVYAISYYYQKSRGVDLMLRFREIPPE
ncbi:MAG: APC family permease [Thaumarchaeota archaeon]|nr:APC family permease [Nitrososphaerota archaeon]